MASKLTKAARGQECTINLYPYCDGGTDTVVFCHAPSEDKGMGIKSPDWWGAYGCANCHDIVDGRVTVEIDKHEVKECLFRGIYRTLKIRIEQGVISV